MQMNYFSLSSSSRSSALIYGLIFFKMGSVRLLLIALTTWGSHCIFQVSLNSDLSVLFFVIRPNSEIIYIHICSKKIMYLLIKIIILLKFAHFIIISQKWVIRNRHFHRLWILKNFIPPHFKRYIHECHDCSSVWFNLFCFSF